MRIHLSQRDVFPWHEVEGAHACGFGFTPDGSMLRGRELANWARNASDQELAALSGSFALVIEASSPLKSASARVDAIRSIPLFWSLIDGEILVSDDARWLRGQTGSSDLSMPMATALMLQGLTIGSETLVPGLFQIRAGEHLLIQPGDNPGVRSSTRDPAAGPTGSDALDDWVAFGEQMVRSAFQRLMQTLEGHVPIVPLSGGLDSRLIAFMLAEAGRMDSLCYSYGRLSGFEPQTSSRVATELGLQWAFIPYTESKWHEWYRLTRYQEYRKHATHLTAIEHEQDWPAVHELRLQSRLPDQAVFIPGHSADFLAGSHLPSPILSGESNEVAQHIFTKYFQLWSPDRLPDKRRKQLVDRIERSLDPDLGPVDQFQRFGMQERQAKMIVNSVQAYEQQGYEWRLPFWDQPFVNLWTGVPPRMLKEKLLYKAIVHKIMGRFMDIPFEPPRRGRVASRMHRVADKDYRRYGMYGGLGRRVRLSDVVSTSNPVVAQWSGQVLQRPVEAIPINGVLAAVQVSELEGLWSEDLD